MANTRPCPTCFVPIYKISGCDQMFCTECHAKFSWRTGKVVKGLFHNPHFFEWIDKPPPTQLFKTKHQCTEFISYEHLLACFSHDEKVQSNQVRKNLPPFRKHKPLPTVAHYLLAFKIFRQDILAIRSYSGNHADTPIDNDDLFMKYVVLIELTKKELVFELEERHYELQRRLAYGRIYMYVFGCAIILILITPGKIKDEKTGFSIPNLLTIQ